MARPTLRKTQGRRLAAAVVALLSMASVGLVGAAPARAATISLDTCSNSSSDVLALWFAILDANDESTHPGPDTINLAPGCSYVIGAPFTGTDYALPPITSAVTIVGRRATITVSEGTGAFGLFDVRSGGGLIATNMTLGNPRGVAAGSYVTNAGIVLITDSTLDGQDEIMAGPAIINRAGASLTLLDSELADMFHHSALGRGGAIHNEGDLYVIGSSVRDNNVVVGIPGSPKVTEAISNTGHLEIVDSDVRATPNSDASTVLLASGIDNDGTLMVRRSSMSGFRYNTPGAAINNSGTLEVEASTFRHNDGAGSNGAGGAVFNSGTATFLNTVFAHNRTEAGGGAIRNSGLATVRQSTFVSSQRTFDDISGVGLGVVTVSGSIVQQCAGLVADGGSNLEAQVGGGCPGTVGDPKLVAWPFGGVNGSVYALGPGSAAIDAVSGSCPANDQRGFPRPGGGACDIGAYENQLPVAPTSLLLAQGANPSNTGSLGFDWANATDADHDTLTYRLYGRDFDSAGETQLWSGTTSDAAVSLAEGTYGLRVEASDGIATSGSASLAGIVVDLGAPSSPTAATDRAPDFTAGDGTGWYRDQVDVTFGGSTDPILADGSPPSGVASISSQQTIDTSGKHIVTGTATDAAGNSSPSATLTVNVDADAPAIAFDTCPASVLLGSPSSLEWTASDPESGLATASSGQQAIETATIGPRTLSVAATDNVGHVSTATCTIAVIYDFKGYFSPIGNTPRLNKASAGVVVPISFSLGGAQGLAIFAAGFPVSAQVACDSTDALTTGQPTIGARPTLVYGGGRYTYQWKTEKAWAGTCRQFIIRLTDGTYHQANFSFR